MANNLETEKKVLAISMLAEGSSIRAIERVTEVHRDTIMRLGVRVGQACAKIQDEKFRGLNCRQIECDEIWGFVGAKRKVADRVGAFGDVWTFIGLDAESKLIPSFIVGKRDAYHAKAFMADLAFRMTKRIQISTDALSTYPDAIERGFGAEVDYGQVIKTYSVTNGFSKKLENFEAAVALNFAYYNLCKIHGAIRCTPAQEAGVEKSQWTVAELIENCGE